MGWLDPPPLPTCVRVVVARDVVGERREHLLEDRLRPRHAGALPIQRVHGGRLVGVPAEARPSAAAPGVRLAHDVYAALELRLLCDLRRTVQLVLELAGVNVLLLVLEQQLLVHLSRLGYDDLLRLWSAGGG